MVENPPLASVIMPCYNAGNLISQSIESVTSQTYKDWELLIIDDCSQDNSADVVKAYCEKDSRIKYLKTDVSSGTPAEPRNVGIRAARGRFIAFLDSDDLWLPSKLENQISFFQSCKEDSVAVVFSNYGKFSDENKNTGRVVRAPLLVSYKKLLNGNCIGNLTGMFDTEKVGKVYQKKIGHEDYLFWLTCLKPSERNKDGWKAANTGTIEACYRQTKTSVSSDKITAFKWTWRIYRKELRLNLMVSLYHFCIYAVKGVVKFLR